MEYNKSTKACPCSICKKAVLYTSTPQKIKTTKLCVMILNALKEVHPHIEYFSLKVDIFPFVTTHWRILSVFKQLRGSKWRKALLDAFNHCTLIQSGKGVCKTRGFYKIKEAEDQTVSSSEASVRAELAESFRCVSVSLRRDVSLLNKVQFVRHVLSQDEHAFFFNSTVSSIAKFEAFVESSVPRQQRAILSSYDESL
ncbi:hypothetical protein EIN_212710 [Entamoeba invadens IP1]|uniref:Uncharacterized protein n=1 Tax=Entamoeba invadens IP1 TaxID=370355 RepID=A0A0A1TX74_ENTIV|nr:hypothetical protein EIN_212710 [Entamoeba invadens IP1]ELP84071.1 hypothetical protein EIN_212710 [Entamoeba invadens IP1]|eukprot:XP_004183417.1 hypothetical protein EIN_212710 [Entamoeba invadens IP1]